MTFKEAFHFMVHGGKTIKRRSWDGVWYWNDGAIWIDDKKGNVSDIRAVDDMAQIIKHMFKNDWEVAVYHRNDCESCKYENDPVDSIPCKICGISNCGEFPSWESK